MKGYENLVENPQDDPRTCGVEDNNIFNSLPMLHDVAINPILADLEIPRDFCILQNPDIWIIDTVAFYNGTTHKKSIMNLKKDETSSRSIGISFAAVKNRFFCDI